MTTELIALQESGVLAVSKYATDEVFSEISKGSSFLPRLQLMGGSSDAVKEGKINIGRFALVRSKDNYEDLTAEVKILVLGWRPKAMDMSGDDIIVVFNPADPEFKRIEKEATSKDKELKKNKMCGPEFLIWVPSAEPATFATFHLGNPTLQREGVNLRGRVGKAATLKSKLITSKEFKWHGADVLPCSDSVEMPPLNDLKAQVEAFNNPPESQIEAAPAETRAR